MSVAVSEADDIGARFWNRVNRQREARGLESLATPTAVAESTPVVRSRLIEAAAQAGSVGRDRQLELVSATLFEAVSQIPDAAVREAAIKNVVEKLATLLNDALLAAVSNKGKASGGHSHPSGDEACVLGEEDCVADLQAHDAEVAPKRGLGQESVDYETRFHAGAARARKVIAEERAANGTPEPRPRFTESSSRRDADAEHEQWMAERAAAWPEPLGAAERREAREHQSYRRRFAEAASRARRRLGI